VSFHTGKNTLIWASSPRIYLYFRNRPIFSRAIRLNQLFQTIQLNRKCNFVNNIEYFVLTFNLCFLFIKMSVFKPVFLSSKKEATKSTWMIWCFHVIQQEKGKLKFCFCGRLYNLGKYLRFLVWKCGAKFYFALMFFGLDTHFLISFLILRYFFPFQAQSFQTDCC